MVYFINKTFENIDRVSSALRNIVKKISDSKIIAVAFLLLMFIILLAPKSQNALADNGNENGIGVVYQHYLLLDPEKVEQAKDQSENKEVKVLGASLGSLGSGGVSGDFSYNDIVSKSNTSEVEQAKKFSTMMSTYSTFGYISTRPQGFSAILSIVGRPIAGLLLVILGFIEDIRTIIIKLVPDILSKVNIIPILSGVFRATKGAEELQTALGISAQTFKKYVDAGLIFAIMGIVASLTMMLRRGSSKIDQRHASKLKGRLATLVILPLVVVGSAELLSGITKLKNGEDTHATFSQHLIDVENWAKQNNFNPTGSTGKDLDMSQSDKSGNSFVDLNYNPYTKTGIDRAIDINSDSPIIKSSAFPNASLSLSYLMGNTFNAQSFIDIKGSPSFTGTGGYDYYIHDKSALDKLKDVSHGYTGGLQEVNKSTSPTGYAKAIDDYLNTDGEIDNPTIAWRDRFIYGTKSSGAKLDDYYSEAPSTEQARTSVGAGSNNLSLSNQSMFLVLSSTFNETGGHYLLDAPARGIMTAKNVFDSSRGNYYSVSMTGIPFFTILALITKPLIGLIALLAVISVVMAVGVIDMNLRPLRAYFLGIYRGDIEYPQAFLVYTVGIAGTIALLGALPNIFVDIIGFVSSLIVAGINAVITGGGETQLSAVASMASSGFTVIISAILAVFLLFKYVKDREFRERITGFFSMVWAWASVTGQRLEEQAMPTSNRIATEMQRMGKRDGLSRMYDKSGEIAQTGADLAEAYTTGGISGVAKTAFKKTVGDDGFKWNKGQTSENKNLNPDSDEQSKQNQETIANTKARIDGNLSELRTTYKDDPSIDKEIEQSINRVNDYKNNPTDRNFDDGINQLYRTKEAMIEKNASPEDIAKIDNLIDDYQDLRRSNISVEQSEQNLNNFIPSGNKSFNDKGQLIDENNNIIGNNKDIPVMLKKELEKRNLHIDDKGQLADEKGESVNNFGVKNSQPQNVTNERVVESNGQQSQPQNVTNERVVESNGQQSQPQNVTNERVVESNVYNNNNKNYSSKTVDTSKTENIKNTDNSNTSVREKTVNSRDNYKTTNDYSNTNLGQSVPDKDKRIDNIKQNKTSNKVVDKYKKRFQNENKNNK